MALFADVSGPIVVFLIIDIFASLVLLPGEFCFVFCGEVAAIPGSHAIFPLLDSCLLSVKFTSLLRCQLATLDPLVDSILLVDLSLVDARIVICGDCGGDCEHTYDVPVRIVPMILFITLLNVNLICRGKTSLLV
jgi:hypothetical protein